MKGLIKFMADNFDAPLEDFHEYMDQTSTGFIEKIANLPLDMQQELEYILNKMTEEAANSPS